MYDFNQVALYCSGAMMNMARDTTDIDTSCSVVSCIPSLSNVSVIINFYVMQYSNYPTFSYLHYRSW